MAGRRAPSNAGGASKVRSLQVMYRQLRAIGCLPRRYLGLIAGPSLMGGFVEAALIFMVIRTALAMSEGVDFFVVSGGPFSLRLSILQAFGLSIAMLATAFALAWTTAWSMARLASIAADRARRSAMAAFLDARFEVQARERPARVQELLTQHVARLGAGATILGAGIVASLNFLAFTVSAILVSPYAAVVMLVGLLIYGVSVVPLTRLTRRRAGELSRANSRYAQSVNQAVGLARETRVFNVGSRMSEDLARLSSEQQKIDFSTKLLARLTPVAYQLVALLLLICGLAAAHTLSIGDVASLGAMVVLLVRAISYGQQVNTAVQQGSETVPFLDELLSQIRLYTDNRMPAGHVPTPSVSELRLEDVELSYDPGQPVLRGISFSAARGQMVGIVGPSGSGKSTLIQVLLRLRTPDVGSFKVNNVLADDLEYEGWYEQVAFVPQDNHLFQGTLLENIRFHRRELTDEHVIRASRMAHLHEDVLAFPDGYETVIGPGLMDLSGGQKQRLGLARALAGRPSVLVLDEPTSALDMRSESLVQQTLVELHGSLTCLIVAHRLSTLSACDVVMVIENGRISAIGPPGEVELSSDFFSEAVQLSRSIPR